jgi:hypothetical protein
MKFHAVDKSIIINDVWMYSNLLVELCSGSRLRVLFGLACGPTSRTEAEIGRQLSRQEELAAHRHVKQSRATIR